MSLWGWWLTAVALYFEREPMHLRLAEYDLGHLTLLLLHPVSWDYRHKSPLCSMYTGWAWNLRHWMYWTNTAS